MKESEVEVSTCVRKICYFYIFMTLPGVVTLLINKIFSNKEIDSLSCQDNNNISHVLKMRLIIWFTISVLFKSLIFKSSNIMQIVQIR